MKTVRYTDAAAKALSRHANMVDRIRRSVTEYASGPGAHRNQVTQLRGSSGWRMRVGNFRVIFEETADEILVTKIGPRGSVYD